MEAFDARLHRRHPACRGWLRGRFHPGLRPRRSRGTVGRPGLWTLVPENGDVAHHPDDVKWGYGSSTLPAVRGTEEATMTLAAPIPAQHVAGVPASMTTGPTTPAGVADTAARVYDAEVNLHHARQSGVGPWISAAYDHLHLALLAHADASGVSAGHGPNLERSRLAITTS